jgi:hypothetical protein
MGARVYNPKTNQFTSKDPIQGGNENSYTYPNDPINSFDCSGLALLNETIMKLIGLTLSAVGLWAGTLLCGVNPFLCVGGAMGIGMLLNITYQMIDIGFGPKSDTKNPAISSEEVIVSGLLALTMNRIGRSLEPWLKNTFGWFAGMFGVAIKWGIKKIIEPIIQLVVSMYFPKSKPKSKVAGRISVHAGGGR